MPPPAPLTLGTCQWPGRQSLFAAEVAAAREELNLLYVAITRARQVFIASGIGGARDSESTPYRRRQAALEKLGGDGSLRPGADLPQSSAGQVALPPPPVAASNTPAVLQQPLPKGSATALRPQPMAEGKSRQ